MTKYAYNDAGLVTRMERLDGSETLTSLSVAYDGAGRPVREGGKQYKYGCTAVVDGDAMSTYEYHADGSEDMKRMKLTLVEYRLR